MLWVWVSLHNQRIMLLYYKYTELCISEVCGLWKGPSTLNVETCFHSATGSLALMSGSQVAFQLIPAELDEVEVGTQCSQVKFLHTVTHMAFTLRTAALSSWEPPHKAGNTLLSKISLHSVAFRYSLLGNIMPNPSKDQFNILRNVLICMILLAAVWSCFSMLSSPF